jgi:hypothetical protein
MFIHSGGGMDREESESSITDRVYRWCLKDPLYRLPIKGASKPFDEHLRWRDISYQPPGQQRSPYTVRLHFLDPIYWRDLLSSYVRGQLQVANPATGEVFAVEQWLLNDHNDEDYNRHLSAVQKVRIKKGRSFVEKYTTKTSGAPTTTTILRPTSSPGPTDPLAASPCQHPSTWHGSPHRRCTRLAARAATLSETQSQRLQSVGLWPAPSLLPYLLSLINKNLEDGHVQDARRVLVQHCTIDSLKQLELC